MPNDDNPFTITSTPLVVDPVYDTTSSTSTVIGAQSVPLSTVCISYSDVVRVSGTTSTVQTVVTEARPEVKKGKLKREQDLSAMERKDRLREQRREILRQGKRMRRGW